MPSTAASAPSIHDRNDQLHRTLTYFNRRRLSPALPGDDWSETLRDDHRMLQIEGQFLQRERNAVAQMLRGVPDDPDRFVAWFEALGGAGPGQGDSLFPWLATAATREQMRWFLLQEVAGEAGFEDVVALTQVKMPVRVKLELARNYWDEMGRGNQDGMHGPMLCRLAQTMDVAPVPETTVWESLALGNLMIGLAANRRFAYQAIGALGAIELTAPGRAVQVSRGLRRLCLDGKARLYFELHATLDLRHSEAWNREILWPLVEAQPEVGIHIAEGALLRLRAGARCFDRYRRHFAIG